MPAIAALTVAAYGGYVELIGRLPMPMTADHAAAVRERRTALARHLSGCATMCYMGDQPSGHVGVRELRQNLSVYLERVKAGESLTVTERGAEVARLVPMAVGSTIERLAAEGRARPSAGSVADLGLPPELAGRPLSETLRDLRAEDDG